MIRSNPLTCDRVPNRIGAIWQITCRSRRLAIVLLFALMTATVAAEDAAGPAVDLTLDASLDPAVDRIVEPLVAEQQAVGYAVGVIRDGRVVCLRSYGLENRETAVPVDRQTMFRWASISKTLTAVAAMQLVEQGKLDLDTDIRSYVPEFPKKKEQVTTRQLLCHQGGIRHYTNGKVVPNEREYSETHPFESVILAIDEFKDSPLIARPGDRFSYSTHAYILLSAVVERAGGQLFAEQVRERICQPLSLTSLQPDYQWLEIPHRAVGYQQRGKSIKPSSDTDVSWKLGGGGYISTIDDLAQWCAALARGDLLKPATWDEISTPQRNRAGRATDYGLGFRVSGEGDRLSIGHSGAQEKTRTYLVAFPRQGIGAVAMTNSEYGEPARVVGAILKRLQLHAAAEDGSSN